MSNDGGPAFPWGGDVRGGISVWDYLAAKAMQASYATTVAHCDEHGYPANWRVGVADDAYKMADAMLAEREKRKSSDDQLDKLMKVANDVASWDWDAIYAIHLNDDGLDDIKRLCELVEKMNG